MRSGTLGIALWLGVVIGGVPSPVAAQLSPAQAEQSAASKRRATILQQSVAQAAGQPGAQMADLSITAMGGAKTMPAAGDVVTYTLMIANAGPSAGYRGRVSLTPDTANISIAQVRGACDALPCYVPTLAPGSSQRIVVDVRIQSEGAFGFTAQVNGLQRDPDQSNNIAVVSVTPTAPATPTPTPTPAPSPTLGPTPTSTPAPAPTMTECFDCQPPPPWWQEWVNPWTLGGALLLGLVLIGVASQQWLRHRARRRWLRRLEVMATLEIVGCEAGPIPLLAPGLTLSVRCEPGEAGAPGAVPINKVVYDD